MTRRLALLLLVAGFVAATSPVWAAPDDNPQFDPDPASPGATATFLGTITSSPFLTEAGSCVVTPSPGPSLVYSCGYDDARRVSGWVEVPSDWTASALPLVLCGPPGCDKAVDAAAYWYLTHTLGVGEAQPAPVTVPTVTCDNARSGHDALQRAGLRVAAPSSVFVVGSQAPAPGATVPSGTGATLYPALVPPVIGQGYSSAVALVTRACGSPAVAGDTAGAVTRQSPSATKALPLDRRVHLLFATTAPPPPPPPPWWHDLLWPAAAVLAVVVVTTLVTRRRRRPTTTNVPPDPAPVRPAADGLMVRVTRAPASYTPLPIPPRLAEPTVAVIRGPAAYRSEEIP